MDGADPRPPQAARGAAELPAEHGLVAALLRGVEEACAGGDAAGARRACGRLREGLEAHLTREETLYFPPLGALRPERRAALRQLVAVHGELRELLHELEARLGAGELVAGAGVLARLAARFATHEADEEAFLDALDATLARPWPDPAVR
jgi:hypothetical protein